MWENRASVLAIQLEMHILRNIFILLWDKKNPKQEECW